MEVDAASPYRPRPSLPQKDLRNGTLRQRAQRTAGPHPLTPHQKFFIVLIAFRLPASPDQLVRAPLHQLPRTTHEDLPAVQGLPETVMQSDL